MNILLINPSLMSSDIRHYKKAVEKNRGVYPPLGLCYVSAALKVKGHKVHIIDMDAYNGEPQFTPDIIGIYVMTWTMQQAKSIVEKYRAIYPSAKFVAGGPNVSSFPNETMEIGGFDYAVLGEAEETVSSIVGLGKSKIINGITISNLDNIPYPDRLWIDYNRYFDVFTRHKRFMTMVTSRGCPYNCIYCDRKNRMGRVWRCHSAKRIVEEIALEIENSRVKEVMFFDDEFIINKDRVFEMCELMRERNMKIDWECRARVDQITRPLLKAMKDAGCYRIRFGFESGNNQVLKALRKGITVQQSIECAKICRELNIEIFGYFMMGCPEETPGSLKDTINLSMNLDLDFALFSKAILIPGSDLFDWGVENGQIKEDHWVRFMRGEEPNGHPAISTKKLPESTIDAIIEATNRAFYFRLKFILKRLNRIRSFNQMMRQFTMARSLL